MVKHLISNLFFTVLGMLCILIGLLIIVNAPGQERLELIGKLFEGAMFCAIGVILFKF